MDKKRLGFPFYDGLGNEEFLAEFPKQIVKEGYKWDVSYDNKIENSLKEELENHFPYRCLLDDGGRIEDWRVGFQNRGYQDIGVFGNKEEPFWVGFEGRFFRPSLMGFDLGGGRETARDGTECKSFYLYNGPTEPWQSQQAFADYMSKLFYIETLLKGPSPFIERFALLVKVAYSTINRNN